jgi:hypothetical protein
VCAVHTNPAALAHQARLAHSGRSAVRWHIDQQLVIRRSAIREVKRARAGIHALDLVARMVCDALRLDHPAHHGGDC